MSSRIQGISEKLNREGLGQRIMSREPESLSLKGLSNLADVLSFLLAHDPTSGKNLRWMAECYARGGYRLEDLYRVREALIEFERVKPQLAVSERDVQRYSTLVRLETFLEPYVETEFLSSREEERRLRDEVMAETKVLVDRPGFKAVIPMTVKASQWWGRGTKWCTAAREEKDNAFATYSKDGALVVFLWGDGTKWQMHWDCQRQENYDFQFMDERDTEIEIHQIEERWDDLKHFMIPVILKQVEMDGVLAESRILPTSKALEVFGSREETIRKFPRFLHENPEFITPENIGCLDLPKNVQKSLFIKEIVERIAFALMNDGQETRKEFLNAFVKFAEKHPYALVHLVQMFNSGPFTKEWEQHRDIVEALPWHLLNDINRVQREFLETFPFNPADVFPKGHPARTIEILKAGMSRTMDFHEQLYPEEIKDIGMAFIMTSYLNNIGHHIVGDWTDFSEYFIRALQENPHFPLNQNSAISFNFNKISREYAEVRNHLMETNNYALIASNFLEYQGDDLKRLNKEKVFDFLSEHGNLIFRNSEFISSLNREDWHAVFRRGYLPAYAVCPLSDEETNRIALKHLWHEGFVRPGEGWKRLQKSYSDIVVRNGRLDSNAVMELAGEGIPPLGNVSMKSQLLDRAGDLAWRASGHRFEVLLLIHQYDPEMFRKSLESYPDRIPEAIRAVKKICLDGREPNRGVQKILGDIIRDFLENSDLDVVLKYGLDGKFISDALMKRMLEERPDDFKNFWHLEKLDWFRETNLFNLLIEEIKMRPERLDFSKENFRIVSRGWDFGYMKQAFTHELTRLMIPDRDITPEFISYMCENRPDLIISMLKDGYVVVERPVENYADLYVPLERRGLKTLCEIYGEDDPRLVGAYENLDLIEKGLNPQSLHFWEEVSDRIRVEENHLLGINP